MINNVQSQRRFLLYITLLLIAVQHNVLAQNGSRAKDHAAKIQEMLAQAHKYLRFSN
jgi:hypothetical protein